MQLSTPAGRRAAALAALAAARLLGSPAAAALDLQGLQVEQATLVYQEKGRIGVVEPVVQFRLPLPGERVLGVRYGFDAMSGASPNGAAPAIGTHTFTSPSGRAYTVAEGKLPVHSFRDQRHAVALDWEQALGRTLRLTAGMNGSFETDYRSLGASLSLARDLNQRQTTLTLGLSLCEDRLTPKGGVPEALGDYQHRAIVADAEAKHVRDALVGVTQVMSRRWLTRLNLGLGTDAGYLTDPYKGLSLVDGEGEPVAWVSESRPDSRVRRTWFWGNALHLGRDVVHADYRHYSDDWGVLAHTVDLQYWWKPDLGSPGFRIRPGLRWYRQGAADAYAHSLPQSEFQALRPAHATADSRLADMASLALSLRVDLPDFSWGQVWIKPMWMNQSFRLSPEPVGSQRLVDLVPDLKVWSLTLGLRTTL